VRFGLLGAKGTAPAPTLFVFATGFEDTLTKEEFNQAGHLLAKHGYLGVALDLPCHGQDVKPQESSGLSGWQARLEKGDALVPGFVAQASAVLDYLVKENYTDPQRIAAIGTSRGGFIALHFAAAEPRVRCIAAFAPVTNLLALREFAGMEKHPATRALNLINSADKLAGRPIWICIGNNDERVNTDDVIAVTRKLVTAAVAQLKPAPVELHVMPTLGHRIHDTAHAEVATWIRTCLK
jgi:dienelactone hydrolase